MSDPILVAPGASRQVQFHQLLVAARKDWLIDGLADALLQADPKVLKHQLLEYVPPEAQQILAGAGIRDEYVFPTPILLEIRPTLVGYYRLLLGSPQKAFYGPQTRMAPFKSMARNGTLGERQKSLLPAFCRALSVVLADLVSQLSPAITARDVTELQLLTLGSFFQGANNNVIGKEATRDVFLALSEIVETYITERLNQCLVLKNASGRRVVLSLGSDPDIRIEEDFSGSLRKKIAIEIKGGTDRSNAHNRAGEAEKSHQKAKQVGYRDFWTLIAMKGLDTATLRKESPTTTSWFDVAQILGRTGSDWEEFRSRIVDAVGIPLRKKRRR